MECVGKWCGKRSGVEKKWGKFGFGFVFDVNFFWFFYFVIIVFCVINWMLRIGYMKI